MFVKGVIFEIDFVIIVYIGDGELVIFVFS